MHAHLRILGIFGLLALALLAPGAPPALAALIGRMLSKSPDARPASMAEVQAALQAIAAPVGRVQATMVLQERVATAASTTPIATTPLPRRGFDGRSPTTLATGCMSRSAAGVGGG